MTPVLARALMRLAAACLGDRRRAWAQAMAAEFEEAAADGHALRFAGGCLWGALRQLPSHELGRFAIANHAVVLVLLVPVAALLTVAALLGFPYHAGDLSGPPGAFLLNDGNRIAAPSFAALVMALAGTHLVLAWSMLERDWDRAAAARRFAAACLATLMIVNAVAALEQTRMLLPVFTVAMEMVGVWILAEWHRHLHDEGTAAHG